MKTAHSAVHVDNGDDDIKWEPLQQLFGSTMMISSDQSAVDSGIDDDDIEWEP